MEICKSNMLRWFVAMSLFAAIVASTAYLIMLGWYNTLLLDDYGMVADVDKGGAYGLMKGAYFGWQSRFSGFMVLGWIYEIWGHASNLVTYTLMMLALGYCTLYYALRHITHIQNRWLLVGVAVLMTNVPILAYFEISTFYWMCCAIYTLSVYATIALTTAIFYDKGKLWKRWLIVIASTLYLCGGAENYTPLVIAVLGVIWVYRMIQMCDWHFWKSQEQLMTFISLVILSLGFITVIAGPGTKARAIEGGSRSFMEHFEIVPYVTQLVKASVIFFMRLLSRSLYYLLLFPIGMLIGRKMKENSVIEVKHLGRKILFSALVAFGLIEMSVAASVYGMGWYASLRAYSFVSFIMASMIFYWGAIVGAKYDLPRSSKAMAVIGSLVIASISVYSYKNERPLVRDIHNQIEMRHEQILSYQENGGTEPLVVENVAYPQIPNSYAILRKMINTAMEKSAAHISEPNTYFPYERYCLSWDPKDFRNDGIKRYFKVDFDIIGWANPE